MILKCPQCGKGPVTTEWKYQDVPYRLKEDFGPPLKPSRSVTVQVPVRRCWKCDLEWTDWVAEELRDAAVKEARAMHPGG